MAALSDSPQILHALTGLDCGWASKLPATIRNTSQRMGLTSGVISKIKAVWDRPAAYSHRNNPRTATHTRSRTVFDHNMVWLGGEKTLHASIKCQCKDLCVHPAVCHFQGAISQCVLGSISSLADATEAIFSLFVDAPGLKGTCIFNVLVVKWFEKKVSGHFKMFCPSPMWRLQQAGQWAEWVY